MKNRTLMTLIGLMYSDLFGFFGSGDMVRDACSLSVVGEHRRTEAETSLGVPFDSAQGTHHVHVTTTVFS